MKIILNDNSSFYTKIKEYKTIGGVEETEAISKLSLTMKYLVFVLNNSSGSYQMFACKSLEEAIKLNNAIVLGSTY